MHRGMDPERPATLSAAMIARRLRDQLGFTGAAISDDMQMGAITATWPFPQSAVLALQAGCDLLIYGNNLAWQPTIVDEVEEAIIKAIRTGTLTEERLHEAAMRTAALVPSA
jgi:beta-N-acetylhexosaminidase